MASSGGRFADIIHSVSVIEFNIDRGSTFTGRFPEDWGHVTVDATALSERIAAADNSPFILNGWTEQQVCDLCIPDGAHHHDSDIVFLTLHDVERLVASDVGPSQSKSSRSLTETVAWSTGEGTALFGTAVFRCHRVLDGSVRRGANQASVLLLMRRPFFNVFTPILQAAVERVVTSVDTGAVLAKYLYRRLEKNIYKTGSVNLWNQTFILNMPSLDIAKAEGEAAESQSPTLTASGSPISPISPISPSSPSGSRSSRNKVMGRSASFMLDGDMGRKKTTDASEYEEDDDDYGDKQMNDVASPFFSSSKSVARMSFDVAASSTTSMASSRAIQRQRVQEFYPSVLGTSLSQLVLTFGVDSMLLWYALLLRHRILFYDTHAHSVGVLCLSAPLLISPIPSATFLSVTSPLVSLCNLAPILNPVKNQAGYSFFIAGTTNPLFESKKEWWDTIGLVRSGTVVSHVKGLKVKDKDVQFIKSVLQGLSNSKSDRTTALGSEQWVRTQFREHTTKFLIKLEKGALKSTRYRLLRSFASTDLYRLYYMAKSSGVEPPDAFQLPVVTPSVFDDGSSGPTTVTDTITLDEATALIVSLRHDCAVFYAGAFQSRRRRQWKQQHALGVSVDPDMDLDDIEVDVSDLPGYDLDGELKELETLLGAEIEFIVSSALEDENLGLKEFDHSDEFALVEVSDDLAEAKKQKKMIKEKKEKRKMEIHQLRLVVMATAIQNAATAVSTLNIAKDLFSLSKFLSSASLPIISRVISVGAVGTVCAVLTWEDDSCVNIATIRKYALEVLAFLTVSVKGQLALLGLGNVDHVNMFVGSGVSNESAFIDDIARDPFSRIIQLMGDPSPNVSRAAAAVLHRIAGLYIGVRGLISRGLVTRLLATVRSPEDNPDLKYEAASAVLKVYLLSPARPAGDLTTLLNHYNQNEASRSKPKQKGGLGGKSMESLPVFCPPPPPSPVDTVQYIRLMRGPDKILRLILLRLLDVWGYGAAFGGRASGWAIVPVAAYPAPSDRMIELVDRARSTSNGYTKLEALDEIRTELSSGTCQISESEFSVPGINVLSFAAHGGVEAIMEAALAVGEGRLFHALKHDSNPVAVVASKAKASVNEWVDGVTELGSMVDVNKGPNIVDDYIEGESVLDSLLSPASEVDANVADIIPPTDFLKQRHGAMVQSLLETTEVDESAIDLNEFAIRRQVAWIGWSIFSIVADTAVGNQKLVGRGVLDVALAVLGWNPEDDIISEKNEMLSRGLDPPQAMSLGARYNAMRMLHMNVLRFIEVSCQHIGSAWRILQLHGDRILISWVVRRYHGKQSDQLLCLSALSALQHLVSTLARAIVMCRRDHVIYTGSLIRDSAIPEHGLLDMLGSLVFNMGPLYSLVEDDERSGVTEADNSDDVASIDPDLDDIFDIDTSAHLAELQGRLKSVIGTLDQIFMR